MKCSSDIIADELQSKPQAIGSCVSRSVRIMLWSHIKLTPYDFSDLQITGECDNRPGTGRFLRIFSCVVTYRTGAVRTPCSCTILGEIDAVRCPWIVCDHSIIQISIIIYIIDEFVRIFPDSYRGICYFCDIFC